MREVLGDVADRARGRRRGRRRRRRDPRRREGRRSSDRGRSSRQTNIAGTANVLDAARAAGVERFVYVSSPSVAHAGRVARRRARRAGRSRPRRVATTRGARRRASCWRSPPTPTTSRSSRCVRTWCGARATSSSSAASSTGPGRVGWRSSAPAPRSIDTTYVDNAADAIVAAADRAGELRRSRVRGLERATAAGARAAEPDRGGRRARAAPRCASPSRWPGPRARVLERVWERPHRADDPPITRFLAEQLSTAHWFDQRETRAALGWQPAVEPRRGLRPARRLVRRRARRDVGTGDGACRRRRAGATPR